MAVAIEADNLTLRYAGQPSAAVQDLSFTIESGEIFGFLGPNGAGKTTTISMLCCLLRPTSGNATIAGFDLLRQAGDVKRQIGLVPQDLALYPTLTARENLDFFGRVYGLTGRLLRHRVHETLEMVGLADRAGHAVQTFSGGMKRRLNIAAGLLHQPSVVFLDEPTVGVDPQSRNFIFESIEALSRNGLTVLYTTHYMEEAARLCDRVAIIDGGRLLALDAPDGLVRSQGGGLITLSLVGEATDSVAQLAARVPGVESAHCAGERLALRCESPERVLGGVMEAVGKAGVQIISVQLVQPSLESVFLSLTGKNLRE